MGKSVQEIIKEKYHRLIGLDHRRITRTTMTIITITIANVQKTVYNTTFLEKCIYFPYSSGIVGGESANTMTVSICKYVSVYIFKYVLLLISS